MAAPKKASLVHQVNMLIVRLQRAGKVDLTAKVQQKGERQWTLAADDLLQLTTASAAGAARAARAVAGAACQAAAAVHSANVSRQLRTDSLIQVGEEK